jgi:hypothetical protein
MKRKLRTATNRTEAIKSEQEAEKMKEQYEKASMEVIRFDCTTDVIVTSPNSDTPLPETDE